MPTTTDTSTPDWEGSGKLQPKAAALKGSGKLQPKAAALKGSGKLQPKAAALRGSTSNSKAEEKPYVHVPGTVHLNAFLADIEEAKNKVAAAQAELAATNERLHQKKVESGMV